jgi:hypothetical protein
MSTLAEEEDSASGTTQLDLKQKQRRSGGRRSCLIGFETEEEERDEMITCDGRSPVPECRGHKRRRQTKVSFDGEGMKKNDGA